MAQAVNRGLEKIAVPLRVRNPNTKAVHVNSIDSNEQQKRKRKKEKPKSGWESTTANPLHSQ